MKTLAGAVILALALPLASVANAVNLEPSREALRLRDVGLAQLENEQPASAAKTFARLSRLMPDDPLPWADLAIAELRQQRFDKAGQALDRALRVAPKDARLLSIAASIAHWQGRPTDAVANALEASNGAPQDVDFAFQLYDQARSLGTPQAHHASAVALDRLTKLRPDNLAVLLAAAQDAIKRHDATASTARLLRIRELAWEAPAGTSKRLDQVLQDLAKGDWAAMEIPFAQMVNLMRSTQTYRTSVHELRPTAQGFAVRRFAHEPATTDFGGAHSVTFAPRSLSRAAVPQDGATAGDFDGDGHWDLAWIGAGKIFVRWGSSGKTSRVASIQIPGRLASFDLNDDGMSDLLLLDTGKKARLWLGSKNHHLKPADSLVENLPASIEAGTPIDFDIDGDLDFAVSTGKNLELYRNSLDGPLVPVGSSSFPTKIAKEGAGIEQLLARDLDRDGDTDLLALGANGLLWLDNLRQGRFALRPLGAPLGLSVARAVAVGDLDNDGLPDIVVAGKGVELLHNLGGRFAPWTVHLVTDPKAAWTTVSLLDADNDGRLDIALGSSEGAVVYLQRDGMTFTPARVRPETDGARELFAADLDNDGAEDLVAAGRRGVLLLANKSGGHNHWLRVALHGLTRGNSKNNAQGLGATLEVRNGRAYQFREVSRPIVHFGLGQASRADVLRIVWPNGVPQNRLAVATNQRIVEAQVLKGSCPLLYAWNGHKMTFVTDLLWNSMLGMPMPGGILNSPTPYKYWAPVEPSDELVRVDGVVPRHRRYDLRVTGELWEAFYFDRIRLWVVDHPRNVDVASNLKVLTSGQFPPHVVATPSWRPLASARTDSGGDVTNLVASRDGRWAHAYVASRYQGIAAHPWNLTLDLGEAPGKAIRLALDAWLFPPDASLNVAVSERRNFSPVTPRLEMETPGGWKVLMADFGLPAGKPKEMVVQTPPLPPGVRRLRIVSSYWIAFDRIRWSIAAPDTGAGSFRLVAKLSPTRADLRYRGFSQRVRHTPWGPDDFLYAEVSKRSPWLPFPGHYTRYGDVRELLKSDDSRTVIVGPGDEIALTFDTARLPPAPAGWERTVFLESDGWGKDADRNTRTGESIEPLPYRGMTQYPYPAADYPKALDRYRKDWLTRVVRPASGIGGPGGPVNAAREP